MGGRRTARVDRGWTVAAGGPQDGGTPVAVTLPHTTAPVPRQGFDEAVYQGTWTYRRRLRLDPDDDRRVVLTFGAVMTAATVWCNGVRLTEHLGGFVPFDVELTGVVRRDGTDEVVVEVDSRERPDVPPFGGHLDYLAFGGIYRSVTLSLLPAVHLADVFARGVDVLGPGRRLDVTCTLDAAGAAPGGCAVEIRVAGGPPVVVPVPDGAWDAGRAVVTASVGRLDDLPLWDVDTAHLVDVAVRLLRDGADADAVTVRTGLRDARFADGDGFHLNGRRLVLRGLNRHQTYPHLGAAAGDRLQRRDARLLRDALGCNAVRTSHYPQDPAGA